MDNSLLEHYKQYSDEADQMKQATSLSVLCVEEKGGIKNIGLGVVDFSHGRVSFVAYARTNPSGSWAKAYPTEKTIGMNDIVNIKTVPFEDLCKFE